MRELSRSMEMLCMLIRVVMVTWLNIFVKNHQNLHLQKVNSIVCILYFSKTEKKTPGFRQIFKKEKEIIAMRVLHFKTSVC